MKGSLKSLFKFKLPSFKLPRAKLPYSLDGFTKLKSVIGDVDAIKLKNLDVPEISRSSYDDMVESVLDSVDLPVSQKTMLKNSLNKMMKQVDFPLDPKNYPGNLAPTSVSKFNSLKGKADIEFKSKYGGDVTRADVGHGLGEMNVPAGKLRESNGFFSRNPKLKKGLLALGVTSAGVAIYALVTGQSIGEAAKDLLNKGVEAGIEVIKVIAEAAGEIGNKLMDELGIYEFFKKIKWFLIGGVALGIVGLIVYKKI
jgi:hypothetical protein